MTPFWSKWHFCHFRVRWGHLHSSIWLSIWAIWVALQNMTRTPKKCYFGPLWKPSQGPIFGHFLGTPKIAPLGPNRPFFGLVSENRGSKKRVKNDPFFDQKWPKMGSKNTTFGKPTLFCHFWSFLCHLPVQVSVRKWPSGPFFKKWKTLKKHHFWPKMEGITFWPFFGHFWKIELPSKPVHNDPFFEKKWSFFVSKKWHFLWKKVVIFQFLFLDGFFESTCHFWSRVDFLCFCSQHSSVRKWPLWHFWHFLKKPKKVKFQKLSKPTPYPQSRFWRFFQFLHFWHFWSFWVICSQHSSVTKWPLWHFWHFWKNVIFPWNHVFKVIFSCFSERLKSLK